MYHHQQSGSSYDYPSYPTTPFEHTAAPPAQPSGRAVRPSTSQTQSPQHQSNFHSSPSYASSTAYPSAPYSISSTHAQQWQQEPWPAQQYTQPFTSQQVQTEMPYTAHAARPDAPAPISTPDARGFPPSNLPPPHEPRRQDSGYPQSLPASSHNSSPPRTRRREKDSPAVAPAVATGSGPDFAKIQDSYRVIMDNANMMTGGTLSASRPSAVETIERMLQSANYAAQMIQSTIVQSNTDGRPTTTVGEKDGPASKRQKGDEHAHEGQTCLGCNVTSTPEWRRGPLGPRTLCNACGLVYAKLLKKRARGETRSRTSDNGGQSSQHPIDEPNALSSGGSEDEGSYGSQDRRSDFGDHGRRG